MSRLAIHFFGTFDVRIDQKRVSRFRSVNMQALLLYLSLQPDRPFHRDRLSTLLWPDETESVARHNLRQTLYSLRKLVKDKEQTEPFFLVTNQTVTFNETADFSCDVHRFEQALERGELTTAVSLYEGELAAGLTTASLVFEEWLRQEREQYHLQMMTALNRLTEQLIAKGDLKAAQERARQQLRLEPWLEPAHQQLMRVLALSGDRNGALAHFELCQNVLADELGVPPAAETVRLLERIQNEGLTQIDATLIAGRYALDEQIGEGGMSIVYRGRDVQTGEVVAIKRLASHIVADRPQLIERFHREGEALQRLDHPHIVKLLAAAEKEDEHYLVMEYFPDDSLARRLIAQGRLSVEEALPICIDLVDALTRAHRLGILHRDLKPANVLLDARGRPLLSDFGLAKLPDRVSLTEVGTVLGTVAYLSPEACRGEPLNEQADIWSLGVLFYEMLTGKQPFAADTTIGTITHILHEPLPDIRQQQPDIPPLFANLIGQMLCKKRSERLHSVRQVGVVLERLLTGEAAEEGQMPYVRPLATQHRPRLKLPTTATSFIGRRQEMSDVAHRLGDPNVRLLTMLGPGGIGKTRLAIEAAASMIDEERFHDGIFFVPLAPLGSAENIPSAIASALDFRLQEKGKPQTQILQYLGNKKMLLVLDNFEHLLPTGAFFIRELLDNAPGVRLLVTSRQHLRLRMETVFVVEGLQLVTSENEQPSDAVALFLRTARQIQFNYQPAADDWAHINQICQLVGGMPLAILLAAAWVDTLPVAEIAAEIQRDIDFLSDEFEDLPSRQRSIRATLTYSWNLLTDQERALFPRLALFRGGFTREAAQQITGIPLRLLARLVNKSLVQYVREQDRYQVHELLRQFAAQKLDDHEETKAIQRAHAKYYLEQVAAAEKGLKGGQQKETLARLGTENENIRAAWRLAAQLQEGELLGKAVEGLHLFHDLTGRYVEGIAEFKQALTLLDAVNGDSYLRARLLNRQYMLEPQNRSFSAPDLDDIVTLFRKKGDRFEEALALGSVAKALLVRGERFEALAQFEARIALYRALDERFYLARSLFASTYVLTSVGKTEEAVAAAKQGTALSRALNDRLGIAGGLRVQGGYDLFYYGNYRSALDYYGEVINIFEDFGVDGAAASALSRVAFISFLNGHFYQARQQFEKALRIATEVNFPVGIGGVKAYFGLLNAVKGRNDEAVAQLEEALSLTANLTKTDPARLGLATVACNRGETEKARSQLLRTWTFSSTYGVSSLIWCLPICALLLTNDAQLSRAAEILALGRSQSACPHGWWNRWPLLQELEKKLAAELSPDVYAAAQRRGAEMDLYKTAVSLLQQLKSMRFTN